MSAEIPVALLDRNVERYLLGDMQALVEMACRAQEGSHLDQFAICALEQIRSGQCRSEAQVPTLRGPAEALIRSSDHLERFHAAASLARSGELPTLSRRLLVEASRSAEASGLSVDLLNELRCLPKPVSTYSALLWVQTLAEAGAKSEVPAAFEANVSLVEEDASSPVLSRGIAHFAEHIQYELGTEESLSWPRLRPEVNYFSHLWFHLIEFCLERDLPDRSMFQAAIDLARSDTQLWIDLSISVTIAHLETTLEVEWLATELLAIGEGISLPRYLTATSMHLMCLLRRVLGASWVQCPDAAELRCGRQLATTIAALADEFASRGV